MTRPRNLSQWLHIAAFLDLFPQRPCGIGALAVQRDAAAPEERGAGAAATRGVQPFPVGNHGENLNESQA